MKNSSDKIGNRIRDLPACSAVPQPIAPPRDPLHVGRAAKFIFALGTEISSTGPHKQSAVKD
jgi:hypothetical protein